MPLLGCWSIDVISLLYLCVEVTRLIPFPAIPPVLLTTPWFSHKILDFFYLNLGNMFFLGRPWVFFLIGLAILWLSMLLPCNNITSLCSALSLLDVVQFWTLFNFALRFRVSNVSNLLSWPLLFMIRL